MSKRAFRTFACAALLATAGVACSSDDDEGTDTTEAVDETDAPAETAADETDAPAASDAPAGGSEFTIEGFAFPEGFTAAAGEAISVVNADGTTHTVTSTDFSVRVDGGATESLTVDTAGEYAIFCEIHPQMTGTITIS